jgi:hypothetical protein
MFTLGLLFTALLTAGPAPQVAPQPDAWMPYRFLLGEWAGEGQGQPGNTTGTAVFKLDLDGRVMVRTSRAAVPARGTQPASVHEDLLVMYRNAPGGPLKAIYFDNEDHTIEYDVSASPDGKAVTFVTAPTPSAPRFRLVYTRLSADTVDVKFEMAPPGSPDAFKVYTQGVTKRVRR